MNNHQKKAIIDKIVDVLSKNEKVLFAYLYGSIVRGDEATDIDIAVYCVEDVDFHEIAADLKIAFHKKTGLSPDIFDVRILNGILEKGDLFSLLYLKNILGENQLLIDRIADTRSNFLERYGLKYRECEGLFQEVLA